MYWDSAATTKPKQEVIDAMMPYFTEKWYNPSAAYEVAREVRRDVENARKIVASSINADPDEIFFTSGGSESNNWALSSYGWAPPLTSSIEHHSINEFEKCGWKVQVDRTGKIDLKNYEAHLNCGIKQPVSIQMANNEIGTIQDIKTLAEMAHDHGMIFHTDAVQAYGKIPIDVKELGVDLLSASGHKIGAPKGIGFLYIKKGIEVSPWIIGSQEKGLRGGTENVPYIMGLAKAAELINVDQWAAEMFYEYLEDHCRDFAIMNGHPYDRLFNIASLTIKEDIDGQQLLGLLHDQGHYVSAGSACNAYSNEPSHVLKAIGLSDDEATRTIRISFGEDTNKEAIEELINAIRQNVEILKMMRGL